MAEEGRAVIQVRWQVQAGTSNELSCFFSPASCYALFYLFLPLWEKEAHNLIREVDFAFSETVPTQHGIYFPAIKGLSPELAHRWVTQQKDRHRLEICPPPSPPTTGKDQPVALQGLCSVGVLGTGKEWGKNTPRECKLQCLVSCGQWQTEKADNVNMLTQVSLFRIKNALYFMILPFLYWLLGRFSLRQ